MSRVEGVFNWYTEHDKNDPNMYELIEVLSQYSRDADENKEKVKDLVELEVERLITNGIIKDQNDLLVKMVMEFADKALKGEAVPQELEDYAKKVAGVSFCLKQEYSRRGETFAYDNVNEYRDMLKLEDHVKQQGIKISDNIRVLMDYIVFHGNDSIISVRNNHINEVAINNSEFGDSSSKFDAMVMLAEPYVYPEKMEEMIQAAKENYFLPLDVFVATTIELGQGMDFALIRDRLREKNLSGIGESAVLNHTVYFAKKGPEFYMFMKEKDGQRISAEVMDILKGIIEENKKLEEQSVVITDSDSYSK